MMFQDLSTQESGDLSIQDPEDDSVKFMCCLLKIMNPYRGFKRALLKDFRKSYFNYIKDSIVSPFQSYSTTNNFLLKHNDIFSFSNGIYFLKSFIELQEELNFNTTEMTYEQIEAYSGLILGEVGESVPISIRKLLKTSKILIPKALRTDMSFDGLVKFMSSHSEIFTVNVNDGTVMLNNVDFNVLKFDDNDSEDISLNQINFEGTYNLQYTIARAVSFYATTLMRVSPYFKLSIKILFVFRFLTTMKVKRVAKNTEELKEFLQQHPDIFTVEGDYVILTMFYNNKDLQNMLPDAIDFFSKVFRKTEECYSIDSLNNYLQNSPKNVRVVTNNITQLKCFLYSHPDFFFAENMNVVTSDSDVEDDTIKKHDIEKEALRSLSQILMQHPYELFSIFDLFQQTNSLPEIVKGCIREIYNLELLIHSNPETFTITNGIIMLTQSVGNDSYESIPNAIKFFSDRIKSLSNNSNVPIEKILNKNTPIEVLHVAKNCTELKFLFLNYPEVFCVDGDNVVLTIPINNIFDKNSLYEDNADSNYFIYNIKLFYYNILEEKRTRSVLFTPISELLIYAVNGPPYIREVTNDCYMLQRFLFLHPDVFCIRGNYVILRKYVETSGETNKHLSKIGQEDKEIVENISSILLNYGGHKEVSLVQLLTDLEKSPYNVWITNAGLTILESFLINYPEIFRVDNGTVILTKYHTDSLIHSKACAENPQGLDNNIEEHNENVNCVIDGLKELRDLRSMLIEDKEKCPSPVVSSHIESPCNSVDESDIRTSRTSLNLINDEQLCMVEEVPYLFNILCNFGTCQILSIDNFFHYWFHAPNNSKASMIQNVDEFRIFLNQYPNDFIITNDNVMARMIRTNRITRQCSKSRPEPSFHLLFLYIRKYTQERNIIDIDKLYEEVGKYFFKTDESLIFNSPQELLLFLKMFPHIFYIEKRRVVNLITQSPERSISPFSDNGKESNVQTIMKKAITPLSKVHIDFNNILDHTEVIENLDRCCQVTDIILKNEKVIALDCEGVNLGKAGELTLIQVGLESGQVYIFDVLKEKRLITNGNLKYVLESDVIIKVIHDCRCDSSNLFIEFGVTLKNIFDTRIAHHLIRKSGICGRKITSIGFNNLCKLYGAPINTGKDDVKNVYKKNVRYWATRPLTNDMLSYAAIDVASLLPHVYYNIREKLKPDFEPLFWKLCSEAALGEQKTSFFNEGDERALISLISLENGTVIKCGGMILNGYDCLNSLMIVTLICISFICKVFQAHSAEGLCSCVLIMLCLKMYYDHKTL